MFLKSRRPHSTRWLAHSVFIVWVGIGAAINPPPFYVGRIIPTENEVHSGAPEKRVGVGAEIPLNLCALPKVLTNQLSSSTGWGVADSRVAVAVVDWQGILGPLLWPHIYCYDIFSGVNLITTDGGQETFLLIRMLYFVRAKIKAVSVSLLFLQPLRFILLPSDKKYGFRLVRLAFPHPPIRLFFCSASDTLINFLFVFPA